LTALEEAMKLAPVYTAAQNANLLTGVRTGDFSLITGIPIMYTGLLSRTGLSSCTAPSGVFIFDPATNPGQFAPGPTAASTRNAKD
jgi:hypothetical protein